MATTIETLKKPNGDQVLPRTRAKAVSMEDGTTVENAIKDISLKNDISVGIKHLTNGESFDAVSKVEVNGLTVTPTVTTYTLPEIKSLNIDTTLSVEGQAADAKAVGDTLETKITKPTSAAVGQVVAVKSVDENGKPVEWEAVHPIQIITWEADD